MKTNQSILQSVGDKLAIGLSTICIIHCLALPLVLVVFPSLVIAMFSDEMFHTVMLGIVLPISLITLTVGWLHHRNKSVFLLGVLGLTFLTGTAIINHNVLGEMSEVALTVVGSALIAFAHFHNARLRHLFGQRKP